MKIKTHNAASLRVRQTISENLRLLQEEYPKLRDRHKLAAKTGISSRSIGYLQQPDVSNPTVDTIAKVAEAFKKQAWQLLDPAFASYYKDGQEAEKGDGVQLARVSADEYKLLQNFRSADEKARGIILENSELMAEKYPRDSAILIIKNGLKIKSANN